MTKKIKPLNFRDILNKANTLIDSKPNIDTSRQGECKISVLNPTLIGYDELASIWGYERCIQIKFRDPEQLIEYQLDLLPWCMGLNYTIWNDNKNANVCKVRAVHIKYVETEEEYFQRMTQQDNSYFSMEELRDAKILMNRIYSYFDIIPVAQEQ
ncbi:hypothetical protein GAP32_389 [Cronobacter phage vB_CsaM_GAP32]|uniref:Uncharacterized protein n=1 Tax=Cronobacter phage vB_CsaM_GAP32 TaxID=1141136 RepID=K4F6E5_9CAUD|nr:hypothetical protein GAP32_389 [Cronobacter phage vB_CsaM_GAP32]AFC21841.1 hypothetical protein GAP32_389 [Cronobacter phage vB_CsaM_GAP32]